MASHHERNDEKPDKLRGYKSQHYLLLFAQLTNTIATSHISLPPSHPTTTNRSSHLLHSTATPPITVKTKPGGSWPRKPICYERPQEQESATCCQSACTHQAVSGTARRMNNPRKRAQARRDGTRRKQEQETGDGRELLLYRTA